MDITYFQKYLNSALVYKNIFIIALFFLFFIAAVSFKHTEDVRDSTNLVVHTHNVRFELDNLLSIIKDAERGQRGFIITHDSSFLEPYIYADEKVKLSVEVLRNILADNPKQIKNLDLLQQLIYRRFTLLSTALSASSYRSFNAEILRNTFIRGKLVMDSIGTQSNNMIFIENNLLENRIKKYQDEISFTPLLTLLFFLFSMLVIVLAYIKISKDLKTQKEAYDLLLVSNETANHAEQMGRFSTWHWDLETNKLIYSDNQYRMLGYEPDAFEPTIEKYLEFVHPDDVHTILEGAQMPEDEEGRIAAFFRIIRKDGQVRYMKSIGKIITNSEGKKFRIGVNQDVTDQTLINLDLEQKNLELKQNYDDLLIANELFNHAENIGGFSTWKLDLQNNKLNYSDNHFSLFGYEPREFEPTLERTTELIHPEDLPIVTRRFNNERDEEGNRITLYRILRKNDGVLRYFKASSKIFVNSEGKKYRIGINQDVTEQTLINKALEQKNLELEHNNEQLASFNHMASHDLQEPLRKIQTFISRISEKDKTSMSESGKEYLNKIQVATTRMRALIDNLILFSNTDEAEKIFKISDLNVLLLNAKQECAHHIEEKKAVVTSIELPVLDVIPLQIEQLFINLISNSLKFSKAGTVPVIKINCEIVNARDYQVLKPAGDKKFYKISVTDNGIGFDQQYSESIFNIFNRLVPKNEYKGTGIGLSICKKIAENHSGFITAEGVPGVGATFNVFLPV